TPTVLRGGHLLAVAWAQGRRAGDDPWAARRDQAAPAHDCGDRRLRRRPQAHPAGLPHRYARRTRLLQARWHPAIRAAPPRGGLTSAATVAAHFAPQRGSPRIEWRVIGWLIINWLVVGVRAPACWRNRHSGQEGL